ncbi:MAG: hypothetical protein ABIH11_04415 [Candidatus Altiarchaeota archaeon]
MKKKTKSTKKKTVKTSKKAKKPSKTSKKTKKVNKAVKKASKKPKAVKKASKKSVKKAVKTRKKPVKTKPKKMSKGLKRLSSGIIVPERLPVKPRRIITIYGKSVDPKLVTRAAIEAYNKRRYTTHDFKASDFIHDPRLHNLMVQIAILDRVEEEVVRIYPDVRVDRVNSVTLEVNH